MNPVLRALVILIITAIAFAGMQTYATSASLPGKFISKVREGITKHKFVFELPRTPPSPVHTILIQIDGVAPPDDTLPRDNVPLTETTRGYQVSCAIDVTRIPARVIDIRNTHPRQVSFTCEVDEAGMEVEGKVTELFPPPPELAHTTTSEVSQLSGIEPQPFFPVQFTEHTLVGVSPPDDGIDGIAPPDVMRSKWK